MAEGTFRDTFSAMNKPEDMDLHCQSAYGAAIQAAEIASPHMVTLLYEQGKRLLGFAQLRWAIAPKCVIAEAPGEIQRLYVVSDAKGKGVAHELMNACIDEMVRRGSDVIWLGVWERNPRAIAFYKKFNFREVGEHVFPLGTDPQRDVVMARPVAT
jgi:ribosomal protein S18 acetylase RimI-like enzyme